MDIVICDNNSDDNSVEIIYKSLEVDLIGINAKRNKIGRLPYGIIRPRSDEPIEEFRFSREAPVIRIIQTGHNGGYAFGNNVGIKAALTNADISYVWVLNNDTIVSVECAEKLISHMQRRPDAGLCGATVAYLEKPEIIQTAGGGGFSPLTGRCSLLGLGDPVSDPPDRHAIEGKLRYINGACVMVSRHFVQEVGFMTEDYFLYFEEFDWAKRARGRFSLIYTPDALVYHKVGASIGTSDDGNSSLLSIYYLNRSRMKFLCRFSKISIPFAIFDILKDSLVSLLRARPRDAYTRLIALAGLPYANI
ncbi:MAG: glycosyltransferase family 2 protein [bacterium]|nr:glycosyltransferase family 2 protein [bacterium]